MRRDKEVYRALDEGAVNFGAILLLLVENGIFTHEEFEASKIRIRAEMDQQQAEGRDE